MDETTIRSWPLKEQLVALDIVSLHRVLDELVLVGALNTCKKDMTPIPKEETLKDLVYTLGSERALIGIVGRKAAATVYGKQQGKTSAMDTVDFILEFDYEPYYKNLTSEEVNTTKPLNSDDQDTLVGDST